MRQVEIRKIHDTYWEIKVWIDGINFTEEVCKSEQEAIEQSKKYEQQEENREKSSKA